MASPDDAARRLSVLKAVARQASRTTDLTAPALDAVPAGSVGIVAGLIDDQFLTGRVERGSDGLALHVYVESITPGGISLIMGNVDSLSVDRLNAQLLAVSTNPDTTVIDAEAMAALLNMGLLNDRRRITELGWRYVQQTSLNATIVSQNEGSQIFIGSPVVASNVSLSPSSPDTLLNALTDLRQELARLGDVAELQDLRDQVSSLEMQLKVKKPNRGIIDASLRVIRDITLGIAGNAAYAGLVRIVTGI